MRSGWAFAGIITVGLGLQFYAANSWGDRQDTKNDKGAQNKAGQDKTSPAEKENALIAQLQAAFQAKKWADAESVLSQLMALQLKNWEYQKAFADTEYNLEKYQEALDAYDKAISLAQRVTYDATKPEAVRARTAQSEMFSAKGGIYLRQNKNADAIDAYATAAELSPSPGSAFLNLCIVQYDVGTMEAALAACEKAQKADPGKADVYYMKGSVLYAMGKIDDNDKFVAPPETEQALKKYLELAPKGPHAEEVKQMLSKITGGSQESR